MLAKLHYEIAKCTEYHVPNPVPRAMVVRACILYGIHGPRTHSFLRNSHLNTKPRQYLLKLYVKRNLDNLRRKSTIKRETVARQLRVSSTKTRLCSNSGKRCILYFFWTSYNSLIIRHGRPVDAKARQVRRRSSARIRRGRLFQQGRRDGSRPRPVQEDVSQV